MAEMTPNQVNIDASDMATWHQLDILSTVSESCRLHSHDAAPSPTYQAEILYLRLYPAHASRSTLAAIRYCMNRSPESTAWIAAFELYNGTTSQGRSP